MNRYIIFLKISPHKVGPFFETDSFFFMNFVCIFLSVSITSPIPRLVFFSFFFWEFVQLPVFLSMTKATLNWVFWLVCVYYYWEDIMYSNVMIVISWWQCVFKSDCDFCSNLPTSCHQVLLLTWPWSPRRRQSNWLQMTSSGTSSPRMGKQH